MEEEPERQERQGEESRTVVVVGPDGRPLGTVEVEAREGESETEDPARLIEQPAKVMRIGSMVKQLLEEVRAAPLDDAGRQRLKEIHRRSINEQIGRASCREECRSRWSPYH